jgi:phytoene dehydrogenase-like protein
VDFDVIVIGGGLGGLSAAASLARAGARVAVLEQHTVPGGYAHCFRRGRFQFEASLHAVDGVAPGGWAHGPLRSLGLLERLRFTRLDPLYAAHLKDCVVTAHADFERYVADLCRAFPAQAAGIRSLTADLRAIFRETRLLMQAGPRASLELAHAFPTLVRALNETLSDAFGRHSVTGRAASALAGIWSWFGLPPARIGCAQYAIPWGSYHDVGAFYPEGGSMAISRALESVITERGGTVMYRRRVTSIGLEGGRARFVRTARNEELSARAIVSNVSAVDTFVDLLPVSASPSRFLRRLTLAPTSMSSVHVYLGLDRDLPAEYGLPHEVIVSELETPEDEYNAALAGDFGRVNLCVTSYAAANPSCAPPGKAVINLMACAPWEHADIWGTRGDLTGYRDNERYLRIKDSVADVLIARAERLMPGLRAAIAVQEVATPLTNVRYTRNARGAIYGFANTPETSLLGRPRAKTHIGGLWLASAWSAAGGGQSAAMISGCECGRLVLAELQGRSDRSVFDMGAPAQPAAIDEEAPPLMDRPHFSLGDVSTQRPISPAQFAGRPLALILIGPRDADAAQALQRELRDAFPLAAHLAVATIVGLRSVPRLFRGIAARSMRRHHARAAEALPPCLDPARYVLLLADWDGGVCAALGYTAPGPNVVVLDREGRWVTRLTGADLAKRSIGTVASL